MLDTSDTQLIYQDSFMTVLNYQNWSIISHLDSVICIPYILDSNKILLRNEFVPSFEYREGKKKHLVCIGGGIEKGESPEQALKRELYEEAGIVLNDDFIIKFDTPLFYLKSLTTKCYPIILKLNENDFKRYTIDGDGTSIDKLSDLVEVDFDFVFNNKPLDIVTEFMLMKLRSYLNL